MQLFHSAKAKILFTLLPLLFLLCAIATNSYALKNDTVYKSSCIPNRNFTWKDLKSFQENAAIREALNSAEFKQGKNPLLNNNLRDGIWAFITTPELGPMGGGVSLTNMAISTSKMPDGVLNNLDGVLGKLGGVLTLVTFYNDVQSGNKMAQVNLFKGGAS